MSLEYHRLVGETSDMLSRLKRIREEFGLGVLLRTLLLLVGFLGMSIAGIVFFSSYTPIGISLIGLIVGYLLREKISEKVEVLPKVLTTSLFIYGVVLFLGDRLGLEHITKLSIITAATVLVFVLQFWSLSDPRVYRVAADTFPDER